MVSKAGRERQRRMAYLIATSAWIGNVDEVCAVVGSATLDTGHGVTDLVVTRNRKSRTGKTTQSQ
jgi:hypothetical protein